MELQENTKKTYRKVASVLLDQINEVVIRKQLEKNAQGMSEQEQTLYFKGAMDVYTVFRTAMEERINGKH